MSRRRRHLRLLVLLLAAVVTLSYMAPMFISEDAFFNTQSPYKVVVSSVRHTGQGRTAAPRNKESNSVIHNRAIIHPHNVSAYVNRVNAPISVNDTSKFKSSLSTVRRLLLNETEGYRRSLRADEMCRKTNKRIPYYGGQWSTIRIHAMFETNDKNVQLCPIWKAGTTFLKRLFIMKINETYSNLSNPYDISYSYRHFTKSTVILARSINSKRFIFVRNPYDRVFSSYIDKLLAPNPYYWGQIGTRAIYLTRGPLTSENSLKCGHDVQFPEYVKYISMALGYRTAGAQVDPHFAPMLSLCQPCVVQYDFIGKMETFKQDYQVLISELNLTRSDEVLTTLERDGEELAEIDAIEDTIHQPFDPDFQDQFEACISRREVLERAWRKMQIRGLISPTHTLPLTDNEVHNITQKGFLELAKDYRAKSPKEIRRAYKHKQFVEFYSKVNPVDLSNLRSKYINDFKLFEYDDSPRDIFPNG